MSTIHIIAFIFLVVSFVIAAVTPGDQWRSAILWAVWAADILYILSGVNL